MTLEIAYPDTGKYRSATVLPPAYGLSAISGTLPPAYGLNETTFDFGFPSALDSRITFTRSTTANRYNSAGTITSTAIDVARAGANQDYNPSTLAARGFLIGAGATNLHTYSQEFDNAAWSKVRSSISANAVAAPDGTTTADSLIEDATAAATHFIRQDIAVTDTVTYTRSIYAKANTRSQIAINFGADNSAFAGGEAVFTLSGAGSIATSGTLTASSIEQLPNGWYRCQASATATATATGVNRYLLASGGSTSYNGDGASGAYVWQTDLIANAFAMSPIVTTTASAARGADTATISTLSSIGFSATQGAIYAEIMLSGLGSTNQPRACAFTDGTANNSIAVLINDSSGDAPTFYVVSGGAAQCAITSSAVTANAVIKLAASWSANNFRFAVNGVAATADTSGTVPAVDRLEIGREAGANYLNGWLRNLRYMPQLLTSAQLASMTA